MASPEVFDIESLLQPINDDSPVGEDLREDRSADSKFYAIKDARNNARTAERNSMFDEDAGSVYLEWQPILDMAPEILRDYAKDLEIAAWYTEALIRFEGYAGLRDGFKLLKGLMENFWDDLYPEPDEDGMETKVAPLTGLNGDGGDGTLIMPIKSVLLTEMTSYGEFRYWQYLQVSEAAKIQDEEQQEQRLSSIGFGMDTLELAVENSSDEFCRNTLEDLEAALEAFMEMTAVVDEKAGLADAPPSSNVKNTLEQVLAGYKHLTRNKIIIIEDDDEAGDASEEGSDSGAGGGKASGGGNVVAEAIKSREQAFKQLVEIADFFIKTEPHSPVSYLLKKTVRWGRMPLNELMRELLPEESAQETYQSLTGVKLEEEEEDDY